MITEDYGLQSTKITKDYRPSVRDYSHVADPLLNSDVQYTDFIIDTVITEFRFIVSTFNINITIANFNIYRISNI